MHQITNPVGETPLGLDCKIKSNVYLKERKKKSAVYKFLKDENLNLNLSWIEKLGSKIAIQLLMLQVYFQKKKE